AAILGAAWATPAAAQREFIDPAQACTPDVHRLCSEFIPDRNRITACLFKKRLQLSRDCRTVMKPRGKAYRPGRS
ncbi:unnamed protein product, partial [Phaeothamnion confervicola]